MAWNDYISESSTEITMTYHSQNIVTHWSKTSELGKMGSLSYSSSSVENNQYTITMGINSSTESNYYPVYYALFNDDGTLVTQSSSNDYNSTQVNYWANNTRYSDGPWTFNNGLPPIPQYGYACEIMTRTNMSNNITTNILLICVSYTWRNANTSLFNQLLNDYRTTGDASIFEDYADYIITSYNAPPKTEPEGNEYTIYNTGQRGTWSVGDVVTDVSTPFYRWARVKLATTNNVDGRLAFYKVGLEDNIIKLIPVSVASVVYCEYSTDGGANWQESDTFPYQYIYGERTNELGTFIYATRSGIGGASGVPVFEDETTALGWVNHDVNVDITDALNYEDIASRYKYTNKTGDNESETTMGTASGFRSHFTQKYLLDRGDVSIIANALFDTTTTIFDDIKKGLEMFGERIIDSICSLTYYPIDLTTVFTQLQSQSYIFFGGYQFQPENFSINKLVGYSGYIDLGSFTIEPTFPNIEDARNYSPFCRVSIFLPYCGMFELDYNKYVNKTIRVRYYIDVNTGGCLVCLFDSATGGRLLDYMNGQIGSQIPITITDYAGYASAELRNISNLAGVGVNLVGSGINVHSGVQTVQNATTQRAVEQGGGEIAKGILGVAQAPVDFAKVMYDLSTTSINQFNSTKGSSGALGNQYLPQYVYLVFEYVRTEETANLLQLEGKPSNRSGTVGSFSGYLEVDSVQLQCSGATENEKRSIMQMLNSGIII